MTDLPPGIAQFFAEEIHTPFYADTLLDWVEALKRGERTGRFTGNSYSVRVEGDTVVVTNDYVAGWQPVRAPYQTFVEALKRHRRSLPGA